MPFKARKRTVIYELCIAERHHHAASLLLGFMVSSIGRYQRPPHGGHHFDALLVQLPFITRDLQIIHF